MPKNLYLKILGKFYTLDEEKVCKSRAEMVLRDQLEKTWNLSDFIEVLAKLIPLGFTFKEEYLSSLVIYEKSLTKGKMLRFLDAKVLSLEPKKR